MEHDGQFAKHLPKLQNLIDNPPKHLSTVLRSLVKLWKQDFNLSPEDINGGFCESFAGEAKLIMPVIKVCWDYEIDQDGRDENHPDFFCWCHCLIVHEGRFYDAERPDGVDKWSELPAFCLE